MGQLCQSKVLLIPVGLQVATGATGEREREVPALPSLVPNSQLTCRHVCWHLQGQLQHQQAVNCSSLNLEEKLVSFQKVLWNKPNDPNFPEQRNILSWPNIKICFWSRTLISLLSCSIPHPVYVLLVSYYVVKIVLLSSLLATVIILDHDISDTGVQYEVAR